MLRLLPRGVAIALAAALVAGAAALAARNHLGFSLRPPHRNVRASAVLAANLTAELDLATSSAGWTPRTTADLVQFSLEETSDRLRLDPGHRTDLEFVGFTGEQRPANCEEYAQLFVAVFRHVGRLRQVPGRATVVRSEARLFGRVLPWRGWRTHDWVRVEDGAGAVLRVDPTLHDAGLGGDVSRDVVP